jgi:hypothetical protein
LALKTRATSSKTFGRRWRRFKVFTKAKTVGNAGNRTTLRWRDLYREAELYKSAVRLYTKPLFQWRKSLITSHDGRTLYDFARHGMTRLNAIHRQLSHERFVFRPGLAVHRNFNGKRRTLYIFPWEERLVDLLLYRLLNQALDRSFSRSCYAYRVRGYGVDRCQRHIQAAILRLGEPIFVMKRDIAEFFDSINHEILLSRLAQLMEADDYVFELLRQRVRFRYFDAGVLCEAARGVPFGTSIACLLANVYLRELDGAWEGAAGITFFRYADDVLVLAESRDLLVAATTDFQRVMSTLRLTSKASHAQDFVFAATADGKSDLPVVSRFRHLGLEYRVGGSVGLSRDKFRKICNRFRFSFRRNRRRFDRLRDARARARLAIELAQRTIDAGVRNVAIIDYYLRHVNDEEQLRRLDRWLAEAVLSIAVGGGHKRGFFRQIPFRELRRMGLPSLRHRRRLILHRRIASSFFIWQDQQRRRGRRDLAARSVDPTFSQYPEAAAETTL